MKGRVVAVAVLAVGLGAGLLAVQVRSHRDDDVPAEVLKPSELWTVASSSPSSPDLVIEYATGACAPLDYVQVVEGDTTVRLTVLLVDGSRPGEGCTAALIFRRTTVHLARPVGNRSIGGGGGDPETDAEARTCRWLEARAKASV